MRYFKKDTELQEVKNKRKGKTVHGNPFIPKYWKICQKNFLYSLAYFP